MMDKGPKQHPVDIWPTPFHNYDPINAHLDNTSKITVELQPKSPLHSIVYPILEANSEITFNFLIRFKHNR